LLERLLPELALPLDDVAPRSLDPRGLFAPRPAEAWLEIGFGAGEHLAALAAAHPDIGFIGVEPFQAGFARMVAHVEEKRLRNVRLLGDDARPLLTVLADRSLGGAFLLFPDPWPKARHHKRRFVQDETVGELARVLADDAEWRLATDDMGLCRWMLSHLADRPEFEWLAERADDWRTRPADWPATRYEQKALAAGRRPAYLRFRRRPRA
jgi:tRNA (guanine-N7-)-methyltransferase